MQKIGGAQFLYSPSDLVHFLSCNHSIVLTLKSFTEKLEKAEESATNKLLQSKGFAHEAAYLSQLKAEGKRVVEIPKEPKLPERVALTQQALQSGADVVYQGVLFNGRWRGDADFLIRVETPSCLGDFSYEVLDTKLARHAEPKHIIQLCVYNDLLEQLQGVRPKNLHIFLGNESLVSFKADDFFYYYHHAKTRFEQFVLSPPADSYPEPCQFCQFCQWKDNCEAKWETDDRLSLVANIQRSQSDKLRATGVETVEALASLTPETRIPDLNPDVFGRLRAQASLQIHKRTTGENKCEVLPFPVGRGFNRLPQPDSGDLFFDMEGDPLHPNGLEYLFGVYFAKRGEFVFVPFWAHSHDEERVAFGQFMQFLGDHLKEFPAAHIYHYNHYETTALKRLACRYAVAEEALDNLLRQQKFVDLFKVVRESIRVSEPAYSIKNLEVFYMEKRAGAVATAGDSIVVYNEWRETKNDELLRQIAEYNEVDCVSTHHLRDWLLTLRSSETQWFNGDAASSEEQPKERKEWEIEYEAFRERLLNDAPANQQELRERITHLLEFHNREAKPQWWASFERQDKFQDELINDTDCLGALQMFGTPEREKQSMVYSYRYPAQEHKIKAGDKPVDIATMKTIGTVAALDDERCIVKIKRGIKQGEPENKINLGPPAPIGAEVIRAAIYRFAENVAKGAQKYQAVCDILTREIPRINGRKAGNPIISGDNLLGETILAVSNLNNSYLFIQGPPGAGKTYTSAHTIVELIRAGKKIGITANSHKAIHNLLQKVDAVAVEKGVRFRGIKKSSAGKEETEFETSNIRSVDKTDDINLSSDLFAGTAWLFADERFDGVLDYLFIDEAGQVSVANVVAMGTAAKNIVLVGDQMQLGQPIQGVHPGEAGLSILEFLLGAKSTIPPERGIFLKNTHRLHPSICQFISDAFYDSRLEAAAENSKRTLTFDARMGSIPSLGIHLILVDHSGCSQKSVEEGTIIKAQYLNLLGQKFQDKSGATRALTIDDILVVTPYNVQVIYLKSLLPEGAKVGTVDKFQGQEAAVVLVSMVTSSAEDLPRNIEFLYSKNRLNVAISRAECLAIVVANPKLLEIPCKTIDQIKLVNTFCWLDDYSSKPKSGGVK
jgi:uncharacterized protein